jgi:hypothetical protein
MGTRKKYWEYGGAVLLSGVSSLIFSAGSMKVWAPLPVYLVILGWILFFLPLLFTPALYLLSTKLSAKSKYFSIITISLSVIFGVLNLMYFCNAWSYGVRWQGAEYTKFVAIENIVGFGIVLILSIWSHLKKSQNGIYAANLILFALLSWCAFPYLGELP